MRPWLRIGLLATVAFLPRLVKRLRVPAEWLAAWRAAERSRQDAG